MAIVLDYCKVIILAILFFLFLLHWRCNRNFLFINWPILGMLPTILFNLANIHDYITQALNKHGGTGEFIPPWFTQNRILITSDSMNVHHITSKNFCNYPKGPQFHENFGYLGQGIFTTDGDAWKNSKALLHSVFKQQSFSLFLEKVVREKLEVGLLPLLAHVEKNGIQVDLQEVFNRLSFDNICSVVLGFDPHCLSIDFPHVVYEKAICDSEDAIFHRYVLPRSFWKLQGWLGIGKEKKMKKDSEIVDLLLYEYIRNKQRKEARKCSSSSMEEEEAQLDLLTAFIKEKEKNNQVDDKFVRDHALTMLAAGKSTITSGLTWFFWLVATHPLVEAKILEEMEEKLPQKEENQMVYGIWQVKELIYLHAAMCESLRLFPPVPFGQRQAIQADTLPSGHCVNPSSMIIYSMYTMGRSKEIWGEDCLEFKPERWISSKGEITHVPSYKFITFNAGPRSCLGKEMSFNEMKMVASAVLRNYHIQLVKGHRASPTLSIGLSMKQGLKVKITKRSI